MVIEKTWLFHGDIGITPAVLQWVGSTQLPASSNVDAVWEAWHELARSQRDAPANVLEICPQDIKRHRGSRLSLGMSGNGRPACLGSQTNQEVFKSLRPL